METSLGGDEEINLAFAGVSSSHVSIRTENRSLDDLFSGPDDPRERERDLADNCLQMSTNWKKGFVYKYRQLPSMTFGRSRIGERETRSYFGMCGTSDDPTLIRRVILSPTSMDWHAQALFSE